MIAAVRFENATIGNSFIMVKVLYWVLAESYNSCAYSLYSEASCISLLILVCFNQLSHILVVCHRFPQLYLHFTAKFSKHGMLMRTRLLWANVRVTVPSLLPVTSRCAIIARLISRCRIACSNLRAVSTADITDVCIATLIKVQVPNSAETAHTEERSSRWAAQSTSKTTAE